MVVSNGAPTELLQLGAGKLDPLSEQKHSQLLTELREQLARHELKVEQMFEKQLEHIAQLVSNGQLEHKRCSHEEQGAPSGPEPVLSAGSHQDDSGAAGAPPERDSHQHGFRSEFEQRIATLKHSSSVLDKSNPIVKADGSLRSSWRPSVKSLTELEDQYVTDKLPDSDVPEHFDMGVWLGELKACRFKLLAKKISKHRLFEYGIQGLIIANGIVLGVQQDWAVQHLNEPLLPAFYSIDIFFAIAFSLELLVRIMAAGMSFLSCWNRDIKWNIFDSVLVASAIAELLMKAFTEAIAFDVSAGRLLRLLRLVRVVRVLRVFRFFKDLRIMVLSITGSLRPLCFAILLLGILIYVISVCFMQFVTEELLYLSTLERGRETDTFKVLDDGYGSLMRAAYTLFMSISGGLSWGEACTPLIGIHPALGFIFVLYIAFAVFCVLNIITGIFVEEATAITAEDEENMLMHELQRRRRFISEAKRFFAEADKDGSGELSWPEFQERCQHVRFQKILDNLGIDVVACGARNVFDLLDFDSNGTLAISEFTTGLQQLRGNARSIDIAGLRWDQRMLRAELQGLSKTCKAALQSLHSAQHAEPTAASKPTSASQSFEALAQQAVVRQVL